MESIEKIVETLIINGTLTEDPGLFYGKMGITIFFFHYARYTGNELYQEYALDLIDELQKQITVSTSTCYDVGLSGVGVGFEYLLQNDFLEIEEDDFFADFDARIYHAMMYEPHFDLSLHRGLTGLGRYSIYRLRNKRYKNYKLHKALKYIVMEITQKAINNSIPKNEQPDVYRFFYDLTSLPEYAGESATILQYCKEWKCIRNLDIQNIFHYMSDLQRLYTCQTYFSKDLSEEIERERHYYEESKNQHLFDIGLLKGWTSEGLLYLTYAKNHDNSWLNLI